jgi:hypothetical protein
LSRISQSQTSESCRNHTSKAHDKSARYANDANCNSCDHAAQRCQKFYLFFDIIVLLFEVENNKW